MSSNLEPNSGAGGWAVAFLMLQPRLWNVLNYLALDSWVRLIKPLLTVQNALVGSGRQVGKSLYCPPLLWELASFPPFLFCFSVQDSGPGRLFLFNKNAIYLVLSWALWPCGHQRDEFWRQAVGWNHLARPSSKSPLCLMAFPLLWGSTYLCVFSEGWVWKKSLLPTVSERGPVVGKVVGSPWRNRCSKWACLQS